VPVRAAPAALAGILNPTKCDSRPARTAIAHKQQHYDDEEPT
jgi:hypothetical protein